MLTRKIPLTTITLEQVKAIYSGKITNWKQLGGPSKHIKLYARKSKISGVGFTLRELVFHDLNQEFYAGTHMVKSSGPAEKAVVKNTWAMTATGISSAKRRDVKMLAVSGNEPTYENIKEGKYILYSARFIL